jgi:hypothetical protein
MKICKYKELCDCQFIWLCWHPKNDEQICKKEICPLKNKRKK